MKLVPLRYPVRSVVVRWRSSLFAAFGIACTVGVLAAILALREGFESLYRDTGSDQVLIYLRPGATSEGESGIRRDQARILKFERPEIERDATGAPIAAEETYLAVNLEREAGGTTNVPLRGVEKASRRIQGDLWTLVEGRDLLFGADELVVGEQVSRRIANCKVGDTLMINVTPFRVVGVFRHPGPYGSEIWGDVERISEALDRSFRQRVVARIRDGTDVLAVARELENDKRAPATAKTEKDYFVSQTNALGGTLLVLAAIISAIMGTAAVLGATTTMLASIGSRTREIGILLSLGFPRSSVFAAFLVESFLVGVIGGGVGGLAVLPFDGIQTGTTNMQTFTEVAFGFHVSPGLLATSFLVALLLALIGGVIPAWRASRLTPVEALRRH